MRSCVVFLFYGNCLGLLGPCWGGALGIAHFSFTRPFIFPGTCLLTSTGKGLERNNYREGWPKRKHPRGRPVRNPQEPALNYYEKALTPGVLCLRDKLPSPLPACCLLMCIKLHKRTNSRKTTKNYRPSLILWFFLFF